MPEVIGTDLRDNIKSALEDLRDEDRETINARIREAMGGAAQRGSAPVGAMPSA